MGGKRRSQRKPSNSNRRVETRSTKAQSPSTNLRRTSRVRTAFEAAYARWHGLDKVEKWALTLMFGAVTWLGHLALADLFAAWAAVPSVTRPRDDPADQFGVPFLISNNGDKTLYDIHLSCLIKKA